MEGFAHKCFRKVKIKEKVDHELEELYNKRTILKNKTDNESAMKLKEVEKELADKYGEEMFSKIMDEIQGSDCEEFIVVNIVI